MGYLISATMHCMLKLVKTLCLRQANPLSGLFAIAEFQTDYEFCPHHLAQTTHGILQAFYRVDTGTILH